MSNTYTNETRADILREMREQANEPTIVSLGEEFPPVGPDDVKDWADRIEAAAKRELSRAAEDAASKATLDRTARDAAEYMAYAMAHNSAQQSGNSAAPAKFDEAAFDAAVSKPSGWDAVADPVAEIRRMRGDEPAAPAGNAAAMREALVKIRDMMLNGGFSGKRPAYIVNICDTALSAPARNCDRYGDEDDAFAAWHDALNEGDVVSVRNAFRWLFAKATEEGESNGSK